MTRGDEDDNHSGSPEGDATDPDDEFDRASDDEMGDGLRRVHSAKVLGGKRLTGADYSKQENSKKVKYESQIAENEKKASGDPEASRH